MRSGRFALLATVLALNGPLATPALAAIEALLFPRLDCFDRVDDTRVTLRVGVDNLNTEAVSDPSINFFTPSSVTPPTSFLPGYTPRVLAVTVPTTTPPPENKPTVVSWILGASGNTLSIDATLLRDAQLCAAGAEGDPSVFPSTLVHTFPQEGVLMIEDPNVTPDSAIILQYVGGERNPKAPIVLSVETGQFTAQGSKGRQFRYVVFN